MQLVALDFKSMGFLLKMRWKMESYMRKQETLLSDVDGSVFC